MRQTLNHTRLFGFTLRTLLIVLLTASFGTVALALDLANDGLIDELLWNVTGETEPDKQLLGGAQYLTNWTRRQPTLAGDTPIDNLPANPFGINAFLEQEAEESKREQAMQMMVDVGFGWLRQQFPWEDIEIDGKGDFLDRRVDRDGDADVDEADIISSWDKYDHIVSLAEKYDIEMLARIGGPTPRWALPPNTTLTTGPPPNTQDFVDYAVAVATRYRGRIHYYQIWNEPNLYPEWGDQGINPEAYADLLCQTHDALKAVDPNIVILTGALGPTIDLSGRNAYDMLFLQRLYDAGGGRCFDVLTAQGYGLFSGPTDRRMRPTTINVARNQWLRDAMIANGDAHKPIWISEMAWNPVPNDPTISDLNVYGQVTMQEAADWTVLAYERAIREWQWIGVINYWFLKLPNEAEKNKSWYYFRLVNPDWTPTPTYYALKEYIQSGEWQQEQKGWDVRAREIVPLVLVFGLAVLCAGYVVSEAILARILRED